jgi:serine/tyrosine/threonine adenylyltransferase
MHPILQDGTYRPDPAITEIADFIADPVTAADFPQTILRFRNDRAAKQIGLADLSDEAWIAHFGRFKPLEGNLPQPLALRYHGHQFRNYNPDIGDGRGFLFAQMRDSADRLMDLGTKGSGQTPYSRFGDGRLTLKGAVREVLATEMLEALGVPTSRTFSVIETGEQLHRGDEPSPTRSAVLVRLNHGHIRIGSFQRLAALRQHNELERLVAYALKHYFNEEAGADAPARLLSLVAERTAKLAAGLMIAGFVHGVLNSDNINISGESFDYGPWRWTPSWDTGFTAAYFDEAGLYAFGRQAEAIHWDTVQLANALLPLSSEDALVSALDGFADVYHAQMARHFCWRLGVGLQSAEQDQALTHAGLEALSASQVGLDQFFYDWRGGVHSVPPYSALYNDDHFAKFRQRLAGYAPHHDLKLWLPERERPCSMLIEEVESIWSPIASDDDWSLFEAKVLEIREMGENLNPGRIEW